jgi:short-subunit dehydrogenase
MEPFALITGASSGIGRAIAFEMARRKISLLLVALPGSGLENVRQEIITRHAVTCHTFTADLTQPSVPVKLKTWCLYEQYNVQYLINNAGFGNQNALESSDWDELTCMMTLNNQALVNLTYLFIPVLKQNKTAHIMNVGSLASFLPIPNKSVYAATKSFVYTFSAALRNELSHEGIKVTCLCPGPTLTSEGNNQRLKGVGGSRLVTMLPQDVATEAIVKMLKGKKKIIPGLPGKLIFMLLRILPGQVVDLILQGLFNHRVRKSHRNLSGAFPGGPRLLALAIR